MLSDCGGGKAPKELNLNNRGHQRELSRTDIIREKSVSIPILCFRIVVCKALKELNLNNRG